jgi:hypothetical protein
LRSPRHAYELEDLQAEGALPQRADAADERCDLIDPGGG